MNARLAAYALLLGNFVVGASVSAPAGMLRQLADGLGVTVIDAGLLVTFGAVILCFGSPIMGWLTSAMDRRILLAASALVMALTNLASAVAPDYGVLLVIRLVMLVGAAPFTPQAAGAIALLVPEKDRPRAIAFVFTGWSLAIALGLPAFGYIADGWGWRASYAVLGLIGLASAAGVYYGLPKGLHGAAMTLSSWGRIFGNRRIMLILAVTAVQVSGQFATFTYIGPLLAHYIAATTPTIGLFFSVFGVAGLLGNIIATRIVAGLGAFQTAGFFLVTTLAGIGLWSLGSGSFWAMAVAAALWGLGFAAINSMQQARLFLSAPALASGTVALNTSCIYIGQAVGSGLGGLLFDRGLFDAVGYMAVAFVAAAIVLLFVSRGESERLFGRAVPQRGAG
jgi:predicted MFS family arabinose efflux permease